MREVFIREREPEDLVRVLMNYDRVKQVKLLDLDGTLHKGLYERRLRGFTSADIALDLMPVMWSSPRYIRNNL